MNPPLLRFLDDAYNFVNSNLPEGIRDKHVFNAAVEGGLGGIVSASIIGYSIYRITPKKFERHLPKIYKTLASATLMTPLVFAYIEPETTKLWIQQHPVYSPGVGAGITGAAFTFYKFAKHFENDKSEPLL
jgi:hypothetical protein